MGNLEQQWGEWRKGGNRTEKCFSLRRTEGQGTKTVRRKKNGAESTAKERERREGENERKKRRKSWSVMERQIQRKKEEKSNK